MLTEFPDDEEKNLFSLVEDAHQEILGGMESMSDAWNDFIRIVGDTSDPVRAVQDAIVRLGSLAYLVQIKLQSLKKTILKNS